MTGEEIEAAYAPFAASLRSGGHAEPADGWPAAMIAAHVIVNNDLIAAAAERVVAGEAPTYDNARAVDDVELEAFVAAHADEGALAREVERSARRLAAARDLLEGDAGATEIQVLISEGDQVIVDGPMPIARLVEGNADFHLGNHREQLRALEPPRVADAPAEFDSYELVFLYRCDEQPELTEEEAEGLQLKHLGHFAHLKSSGAGLLYTGPLRDQPDESLRGIAIYRTGSVETARRLAEDDPIVRAGVLRIEAMRWFTGKGALTPPS